MVSSTSGCGVERHPDFLPDIMELLAYGICWGSQMFSDVLLSNDEGLFSYRMLHMFSETNK